VREREDGTVDYIYFLLIVFLDDEISKCLSQIIALHSFRKHAKLSSTFIIPSRELEHTANNNFYMNFSKTALLHILYTLSSTLFIFKWPWPDLKELQLG
jgi:hypothetical protein